LSAITIPLSGYLSDRIGRKKMYIIGAATMGVFGFIYFALIDTGSSVAEAIRIADRSCHQFSAHDPCVEIVGTFPIGDVNDAVIELCRDGHSIARSKPHFIGQIWSPACEKSSSIATQARVGDAITK
jgi:hypothetical protein